MKGSVRSSDLHEGVYVTYMKGSVAQTCHGAVCSIYMKGSRVQTCPRRVRSTYMKGSKAPTGACSTFMKGSGAQTCHEGVGSIYMKGSKANIHPGQDEYVTSTFHVHEGVRNSDLLRRSLFHLYEGIKGRPAYVKGSRVQTCHGRVCSTFMKGSRAQTCQGRVCSTYMKGSGHRPDQDKFNLCEGVQSSGQVSSACIKAFKAATCPGGICSPFYEGIWSSTCHGGVCSTYMMESEHRAPQIRERNKNNTLCAYALASRKSEHATIPCLTFIRTVRESQNSVIFQGPSNTHANSQSTCAVT